MTMLKYLREVWEDLKAFWRQEVRVAPRGTVGRIYTEDPDRGGPIQPRVKAIVTITKRVYRAAEGRWYTEGELNG